MLRHAHHIVVLVLVFLTLAGCKVATDQSAPADFSILAAAAPDSAALFAPGVVNRGLPCRDVAIAPGGDEIWWCEQVGDGSFSTLITARRVGGVWQEPAVAPFSGDPRWRDIEPAFSHDGRTLFFASDRPASGDGPASEHMAIWRVHRTAECWSLPDRLPDTVNEGPTFFPSPAADGTLYLTRDLEGGVSAIFRSRLDDGVYQPAEMLPPQVNAGRTRFNAVVDPQERFLIVPIFGLSDSRGGVDYYLVVRNLDDTWQDPVNLGDAVNSDARREWSAALSPDGSALFFMSDRPVPMLGDAPRLSRERLRVLHQTPGTGQAGIWWINTGAVAPLRPYATNGALPAAS
jgi:hypothetical protein